MSRRDGRVQRRDPSGGIVETILGIFLPFASISRELQSVFNLDRAPGCRAEHGRFEILIRGAGMTAESMERRVALAHGLDEAVRPLLRDEGRRRRRYAERAIAIVFEDEQIVGAGIGTSRFTYVARMDEK